MKRVERRHLKENKVRTGVTRAAEFFEKNRPAVLSVLAVVAVLAIGAAGWSAWSSRGAAAASEALARAIAIMNAPVVPPAPPAASEPGADSSDSAAPSAPPAEPVAPPPGTHASERARLEAALPGFLEAAAVPAAGQAGLAGAYHAAAVLAELGRFDEASAQYQRVRDQAGAGIYAEMARLGLAEVAARQGRFDDAIAIWRDASGGGSPLVPIDGALMKLGQSYVMAGRSTEALEAFRRLVDDHPDSQYAAPARDEIAELERTTPQ